MAQLSKQKLRIHCQWIKNQRSIKKGKEKVQDRQQGDKAPGVACQICVIQVEARKTDGSLLLLS
jgi:hypothetical protein